MGVGGVKVGSGLIIDGPHGRIPKGRRLEWFPIATKDYQTEDGLIHYTRKCSQFCWSEQCLYWCSFVRHTLPTPNIFIQLAVRMAGGIIRLTRKRTGDQSPPSHGKGKPEEELNQRGAKSKNLSKFDNRLGGLWGGERPSRSLNRSLSFSLIHEVLSKQIQNYK